MVVLSAVFAIQLNSSFIKHPPGSLTLAVVEHGNHASADNDAGP